MKQVLMIFTTLLCMVTIMSGCSKTDKNSSNLTRNPKVITLSEDEMNFDEFLYYITYYESYGEYSKEYYKHFFEVDDFWSMEPYEDGNTNSKLYKENAYNHAISNMILADCAMKEGFQITKDQEAEIESYANEFLTQYSENPLIKEYVTKDGIYNALRRKYLASEYEQFLRNEVAVEESVITTSISKEEFREFKTEYLFLQVSKYDKNNVRVDLTEEEKEEKLSIMREALDMAKAGSSFEAIKTSLKEKVELTYTTRDFTLQNESIEEAYIDASKDLENLEISDIVEGEYGYYIIKMLDNNSFDSYDQTIQDEIVSKSNEKYQERFNEIKDSYQIVINEELKEQLNFGSISIAKEE